MELSSQELILDEKNNRFSVHTEGCQEVMEKRHCPRVPIGANAKIPQLPHSSSRNFVPVHRHGGSARCAPGRCLRSVQLKA